MNAKQDPLTIALTSLGLLQAVMLAALFTRTEPHPPLTIPLFALAPFLGASITACAAAVMSDRHSRFGLVLSGVALFLALVSFGPQKWFDPAFPQIWPAVIAAQICICAGAWRLVAARFTG